MTGSTTWEPAVADRLSRLLLAVLFGGLPELLNPLCISGNRARSSAQSGREPLRDMPRPMPRSAVLRFGAEKGQQLLDNPVRALFRDPVTAFLDDAAAHVFGYAAP